MAASDTALIRLKPFEESQRPDSDTRHNNKGILQAFFNLTRALLHYYFASLSRHHLDSVSICPSLSAATPFDVRGLHSSGFDSPHTQSRKRLFTSAVMCLLKPPLLFGASTFTASYLMMQLQTKEILLVGSFHCAPFRVFLLYKEKT